MLLGLCSSIIFHFRFWKFSEFGHLSCSSSRCNQDLTRDSPTRHHLILFTRETRTTKNYYLLNTSSSAWLFNPSSVFTQVFGPGLGIFGCQMCLTLLIKGRNIEFHFFYYSILL